MRNQSGQDPGQPPRNDDRSPLAHAPPNAQHQARRGGRIVTAVVIVVLLVAIGVVGGFVWVIYTENGTAQVTIEIAPGDTLDSISTSLAARGLIRSSFAFELYARARGADRSIQAGSYLIAPPITIPRILDKLVGGDALPNEIPVTIPEGWTIEQIALRLEDVNLVTAQEFTAAAAMGDAYRDLTFLDSLSDGDSLQGFLFPDTYRIFKDATAPEIVRKFLVQFRVQTERAGIDTSSDSELFNLVTLASIVQREATNAGEMADVAGVFGNRLEIGMRLESDATVNFALGTSRRQPTFADTATPHPYNTYLNRGLPPGPIGNPGIEALIASANPSEHDFLFFLHPLGEPIVMSRTFEEHLENKARYLD